MRIEPYKDWVIRTIPMNVILCKSAGFIKVKDKDGNETGELSEIFKDETSHASVPQALKALCRKELNASSATSFKEFKAECDKLEMLLNNIAKELKEDVFYE
jgi:hypothetical protein